MRIEPYQAAWYGFILTRRELSIRDADYSVEIKGDKFYRYKLADKFSPDNRQEWAKNKLFTAHQENDSWLEYRDDGLGEYRAAHLVDNQLDSVVFIASHHNLPDRHWLTSLFGKTELDRQARKALLIGLPPIGEPDIGPIVCACFNVGEKIIK